MTSTGAIKIPAPGQRRPNVVRWTGISALAVAVLMAGQFVVQMSAGARPELDEPEALAEFFAHTANYTLFIILFDSFLMAALIVFLGCLRQIVTQRRHDLEWIADLGYGAGLVWVAVTLVGDGIEGGAALDTVHRTPDPSAIRALTEGHLLLFGTIGCVLTALVVAAYGYVTLASDVLPRWTGIVAYVSGALNLVAVPTMFGGTGSQSAFAAGGWATTAFATFPFLAWAVAVGVVTIRGRRHHQRRDRRLLATA